MAKSHLHQNPHLDYLPLSVPSNFLPPISRWITVGGIFLLGTVGTLISIVALMPYTVMIKADARIRPSGELRLVQSPAVGKVKNILVTEYQVINQDDVIVALDDSDLVIQSKKLQSSIQQNKIQLARTDAQLEAVNQKIIAEQNRIDSAIAAAEAELSLQQRRYQDKKITTVAEVSEIEAALKLAQEEYKRYQQLANTGAISLLQLKEKEAALETILARLEKFKAALNPSKAEIDIAEKGIIQTKATGKATIASLIADQEKLKQQKAEITNSLYRHQQELEQVETKLKETIIRSPVAGTIQKLHLRNINQVVQPGDMVAQVAPSNIPLEIKSWVASEDISKLQIGQKALVKVFACPYPDYGTLSGSVSTISPDSLQDNNMQIARYEVTIQPDSLSFGLGNKECTIQAGMESRAEIFTEQETILTFLLRKARLLSNL